MQRTRFLLLLFPAIFIILSSNGQVAFVTKTSAMKIGKNETIEVSYEAQEAGIQNFSEPRFPGWHLVGGPSLSSSTVVINGKKTSSMSYQFLLKPESTGKLVIPAASAVLEGKKYTSNSVTIEVVNKDVVNANSAGTNIPDPFQLLPEPASPTPYEQDEDAVLLKPGEDISTKTKENLFAVVEVSKKTCYPGEAIKASYKLYSRVSMDARITKRPSFSGFSSIDIPDDIAGEYGLEKLNGKTFKVYPIRTVQLYPLQSGIQTLQPVEIESTVQYRKVSGDPEPFDPFGGAPVVSFPYVIRSEPVNVNVLPFPESAQPADFSGVTGNFNIEANTDYSALAKSEAGLLRVTISGSGNWAMVQPPKVSWPAGVEVFEPNISEKLDSQAVPISGRRVYEFPFTSNKAGIVNIPAIKFLFFDAAAGQYKTVSSSPVTVTIKNTKKPLHKQEAVYVSKPVTDGTEIFSTIVKFVFPAAAILLVSWFVISWRGRKKNTRAAEAVFTDRYRSPKQRSSTDANDRYAGMISVNKPTAPAQSFKNEEIIVEKDILVNEHAGFIPVTSKEYFTIAKRKINDLLKAHFNINDQPAYITRQSLLKHGLSEEESGKIAGMLQLCEKHIYSPFAEDFDAGECNNLLTEITSIIQKRKQA